jgi:hypothetical protein
MKLGTREVFSAAVPIVLLLLAAPDSAWVWGWNYGRSGGNCGWWDGGCESGNLGGGWYHQGAYQNGHYAGTQDAIYDHENNLVYTDQPSCLSCHSQLYLDGFRHGYDQQWNSYQNQESTQGTSINIYGNDNYVDTNQYSGQNQYQQGPGPNSDFNPPNCWGSNNIPCNNEGGPDP